MTKYDKYDKWLWLWLWLLSCGVVDDVQHFSTLFNLFLFWLDFGEGPMLDVENRPFSGLKADGKSTKADYFVPRSEEAQKSVRRGFVLCTPTMDLFSWPLGYLF